MLDLLLEHCQISPHIILCTIILSASLTWFLDSNSTVQILLALGSYLYMYQVKTFSVFKHYKDKTESQEEEKKWIISVISTLFWGRYRPYNNLHVNDIEVWSLLKYTLKNENEWRKVWPFSSSLLTTISLHRRLLSWAV